MYEMEGPRLRHTALACRLLGHRALRDACPAALASRLLRCRVLRGATGVRFPAVRAGCPALPSFPWFPSGRIPSSVVRDFYCLSAAAHKAFPREVQDSLAIHRTSVVYPLCTAAFHRAMHRFVHSGWGLRLGVAVQPRRTLGRLTACAEAFQKEAGEAGRISFERKAADVARPRPAERGRPDAEDRGQGPQPGPASQDHRDCWPGECPHRGRRRLHPARIRARNIGPAELGHQLERLGYRQLRCQ
jgi:hypothetical protein